MHPRLTSGTQCVAIVALMNWRVHGIGADRAFEQLVDAGGGSDGGGAGNGSVGSDIASGLGKFMVVRMRVRMRVQSSVMVGMDLVLIKSI